jgi:hypothetical protein
MVVIRLLYSWLRPTELQRLEAGVTEHGTLRRFWQPTGQRVFSRGSALRSSPLQHTMLSCLHLVAAWNVCWHTQTVGAKPWTRS